MKSRGVTAVFTSLRTMGDADHSEQLIGSLIDTWLILKLRLAESDTTRVRLLYVLKSRGMAHSHEVRCFDLSEQEPNVEDRYTELGAGA